MFKSRFRNYRFLTCRFLVSRVNLISRASISCFKVLHLSGSILQLQSFHFLHSIPSRSSPFPPSVHFKTCHKRNSKWKREKKRFILSTWREAKIWIEIKKQRGRHRGVIKLEFIRHRRFFSSWNEFLFANVDVEGILRAHQVKKLLEVCFTRF